MIWLPLLLACGSDPAPPAEASMPSPTEPTSSTPPTSSPSSTTGAGTWSRGDTTTTVTVAEPSVAFRTYTLATDQTQHDGGSTTRTVTEQPGDPILRTGSVVQDALFALAMAEVHEASVDAITDGAFADGAPTLCDCFETGEKWTYVWTRDTAYAAHLALAWIDPARTANSLRYKLAAGKPGTGLGLHIVQDTGTGGSWPVSTDRVTWALGALETWRQLQGSEADAFGTDAAEALANTLAQDAAWVVDPADGLVRGETSFLDWREQTYPLATAVDTVPIAEGKALSTNLAHLHARRAAAELTGDADFAADADALATAIDRAFWVDALGGWARDLGPPLDPGPRHQLDLLGTGLAALLLDGDRPGDALAAYPHGPVGASVVFPNQPGAPIYHNRGQWPFVTAYALWGARRHRLAGVFERDAVALVDGAAFALSNLENFEWSTQSAWVDDGAMSGPVVNSRRQLWSVAGYLALWLRGIGGLELDADGLHVDPFLPVDLAGTLGLGDRVVLSDLPVAGRTVTLELLLPADRTGAVALGLGTLTVDGTPVTGAIALDALPDGGVLQATLVPVDADPTVVEADPDTLAPDAPTLAAVTLVGDRRVLDFTHPAGSTVDVIRDGVRIATGVTGPSFTEPDAVGVDASPCYSLAAVDAAGRTSHRSPVVCDWGDHRLTVFDAYDLVVGDGVWSTAHGRPHVGDWGDPSHTATLVFRPTVSGPHELQIGYANGAGPVSTGITAAHKRLVVEADGAVVVDRPVVMPHTADWGQWARSTTVPVTLDAGTTYTLTLSDGPNMSDLDHFTPYTGGEGGGDGVFHRANLAEVVLLAREGRGTPPAGDTVPLDGSDDLGAFAPATQEPVGVARQPWEAFAFDSDADHVYLAWVTEAAEDPLLPAVLYLEADPGPALPGQGFDYLGLVPELPFTPTHAIALRSGSDLGDGFGPWSGVWARDPVSGGWTLLRRLRDDDGVWVADDRHTLSARVPRYLLGDPARVRMAGHVVNAAAGEEWKTTVPAAHTPWAAGGGQALERDLR